MQQATDKLINREESGSQVTAKGKEMHPGWVEDIPRGRISSTHLTIILE